jgi:predicted RNA-binding Zn ribbon-like protein
MSENRSHPRPVPDIRLDGGRLCIDFVNTIHDWFAVEIEDYIATPERYLEWAWRAGAIGPDEAIGLSGRAGERGALMADIRAFRDALYRLLLASAEGAPLPADALRLQNIWLKSARQSESLADGGALIFHAEQDDDRAPLKRIALDLVYTLADARAGKLKLRRCANCQSCGWLFADTSKSGRRRWCAMETCGTISKMATRRSRNEGRSSEVAPSLRGPG